MGEVVPFPVHRMVREDEPHGDVLVRHAMEITKLMGDDMTGFFIVGVGENGHYSCGWRQASGLTTTLFGALVVEAARREIITQTEACDVFNRKSGFTIDEDDGA